MNCGIAGMAKKANLAKQWQEALGQAEVTDRQPSAPAAAALYMMQLRSAARKISAPRRRLTVAVEDEAETPRPVKINRHR